MRKSFIAQLNVSDKMLGPLNKQIINFYLKHLHTRLCKDLQELSICLQVCKVLNHSASLMAFVQKTGVMLSSITGPYLVFGLRAILPELALSPGFGPSLLPILPTD